MTNEAVGDESTSNTRAYSCWQMLSSAFGVAISPRCLLLAAMGAMASSLLWFGVAKFFPVENARAIRHETLAWTLGEMTELEPTSVPDSILDVPVALSLPFVRLFQTGTTWNEVGYNALGGVGSVLIWSFFGLAISRIAMFRCGRNSELSLRDGIRYSKSKWSAVAGAVLATFASTAAIGLPIMALGWLIRSDVGMFAMACLWVVMLFIALLMAIMAIGLLLGWPLMWGAIAAEDSDLFDAISRSFAYTYQRPLHYLWFALLTVGVGLLGWAFATVIAQVVVELTYWCVQVSGGANRLELFRQAASQDSIDQTAWVQNAGQVMAVWALCVRVAASAFSYSLFWAASASTYLMLRCETDETPVDDIIENGH